MCARSYRLSPAFALSQETQSTRWAMSFLLLHSLSFCVLFNIRTPYMYQSGSRVGVSVCDITCGRTPPAARITLANTLFAHISGLNAHAAIVTALIERRQARPLRLALMRLIVDVCANFHITTGTRTGMGAGLAVSLFDSAAEMMVPIIA